MLLLYKYVCDIKNFKCGIVKLKWTSYHNPLKLMLKYKFKFKQFYKT